MNTELYDKIMELYSPSCQYMKDIQLDHLKAKGIFKLEYTSYTTTKLQHMTSIEANICLNQLAFYAFGEWLSKGDFSYSMNLETYVGLMKENMFVLDIQVGFRKHIATNKEIIGNIEVQDFKKIKKTYFVFLNYELEQGKSFGNIKLAMTIDDCITNNSENKNI